MRRWKIGFLLLIALGWSPVGGLVPTASAQTDPVFVGAGDIADCTRTQDESTAVLLDGIAGTVFTAGDNVYPDGTAAEFASCYGPSWGRHKARTRPAPGNHDYHSSGAAPYFAYFGANAGPAGLGYYSYDLGDWHIISLNSEIPAGAGSAQEQWLRADLAANPAPCTLAYWHKPLFSSGSGHGNDPHTLALFEALYELGADVVISGHDHNYERFAPQDPDAQADPTGIRLFVAGTGGTALRPIGTVQPNSQVRNANTYGVLKLTLHPTSYDWQFVPIAGQTFQDSGTTACLTDDPTIASISPTSGIAIGNVLITIIGANFVAGSTVTVGGASATNVAFVNSTQMTARTPARPAGTLNTVTVTTAAGASGSLPSGFMADFLDVPAAHVFHPFVERIFRHGMTGGCSAGTYCPDSGVTRAEMAVFILRGRHGTGYTPPPATGTEFLDVPIGSFAAAWIEQLSNEGITGGCGGGNYCPNASITRAQMSVFLLRGKYGSSYVPPAATGTMFLDVPLGSFAAAWIERIATEGITSGCSTSPPLFCPNTQTTRGQMAVFLTTTFSLP